MGTDASELRYREIFRRLESLERATSNGTSRFVRKDVHGETHKMIEDDILEIKLLMKEDKAAKDQDRRLMRGVMYTALASLAVGIVLALASAFFLYAAKGAGG